MVSRPTRLATGAFTARGRASKCHRADSRDRMRSHADTEAGTVTIVADQQAIMPMPPMRPNCEKPRRVVMVSAPYAAAAAKAASPVPARTVTAASTRAASMPSPAPRRSR